MTKEDFLKRCETVYDKGLAQPSVLSLLNLWADFVLRYEHTMFSHGQSQGQYVWDFMERERERLGGASCPYTLASDNDGYAIVQLAAILSHPCQKCAEDRDAWHTRTAFCNHKEANR
jgi:hypothetical protein